MIAAGDIALMVNTPFGHATRADGYELRLEAVKHGVTHVTNLAGAQAMVAGMEVARDNGLTVVALQDLPAMGAGGGTGVSASRKGGAQGRSVLRAASMRAASMRATGFSGQAFGRGNRRYSVALGIRLMR